jgi:hypothetical protein
MTKKYHRRRNLKGGFLDSLGQTFSNLGTSITQGASSVWNKTKKATGMDNSTYIPSSYSQSRSPSYTHNYPPPPPQSQNTFYNPETTRYSYGGKRVKKCLRKTKRSRTMKRGGNFIANEPINSLASRAGDFTGGLTARVHNLVGGKKRKSRRARR